MSSVTYVLYSENASYCILVDCGEWEPLKSIIEGIGKTVKTVLLTHGHFDHIYGLVNLLRHYADVEVFTTEYGHLELHSERKNLSVYFEQPFTVEEYRQRTLQGGECLHFDGLCDVDVIATPGHSPSCLSYRISNPDVSEFQGSKGCIFTGDAYIPGQIVFSKFPNSNKILAEQSLSHLSQMERDGYDIHCGHHSIDISTEENI